MMTEKGVCRRQLSNVTSCKSVPQTPPEPISYSIDDDDDDCDADDDDDDDDDDDGSGDDDDDDDDELFFLSYFCLLLVSI